MDTVDVILHWIDVLVFLVSEIKMSAVIVTSYNNDRKELLLATENMF